MYPSCLDWARRRQGHGLQHPSPHHFVEPPYFSRLIVAVLQVLPLLGVVIALIVLVAVILVGIKDCGALIPTIRAPDSSLASHRNRAAGSPPHRCISPFLSSVEKRRLPLRVAGIALEVVAPAHIATR